MTRTPDALAAIKALYYGTTKTTVVRDLDRAIDLLKTLPSDGDREKAAVYMDGLAQMRSEWGIKSPAAAAHGRRPASAVKPAGTTTTRRGGRPAAKAR